MVAFPLDGEFVFRRYFIRRGGMDVAGISLGDGDDPGMLRVVRGHANFAEYVPLALIMLAILELGGTSLLVLHLLGLALLAGRLLHGYALSFTQQFGFGRFWGTLLTYAVLTVEALLCLHLAVLR